MAKRSTPSTSTMPIEQHRKQIDRSSKNLATKAPDIIPVRIAITLKLGLASGPIPAPVKVDKNTLLVKTIPGIISLDFLLCYFSLPVLTNTSVYVKMNN
ncbi:hypothetical protein BpHYR1_003857 [Brachionus plicatilis]|uniref:Uncharacterized protein n=1 Tax=Brachionus plicatilis TaxID=10195 RepID=A0A3M7P9Z1_BRAPC|nr:hypothetical protein BpHYR1_003857 [Brachionus plicatilis]